MPSKQRGVLSPNQLVAFNLKRARQRLGLTQEEAAAQVAPFLGVRWSKATWSQAESSYGRSRARPFDADELLAFSRAFRLPLSWWFLPPEEDGRPIAPPGAEAIPLGQHRLLDLLFRVDQVEAVVARLGGLRLPPDLESEIRQQFGSIVVRTALGDVDEHARFLSFLAGAFRNAAREVAKNPPRTGGKHREVRAKVFDYGAPAGSESASPEPGAKEESSGKRSRGERRKP